MYNTQIGIHYNYRAYSAIRNDVMADSVQSSVFLEETHQQML